MIFSMSYLQDPICETKHHCKPPWVLHSCGRSKASSICIIPIVFPAECLEAFLPGKIQNWTSQEMESQQWRSIYWRSHFVEGGIGLGSKG